MISLHLASDAYSTYQDVLSFIKHESQVSYTKLFNKVVLVLLRFDIINRKNNQRNKVFKKSHFEGRNFLWNVILRLKKNLTEDG
jgi:hypothetical protein